MVENQKRKSVESRNLQCNRAVKQSYKKEKDAIARPKTQKTVVFITFPKLTMQAEKNVVPDLVSKNVIKTLVTEDFNTNSQKTMV